MTEATPAGGHDIPGKPLEHLAAYVPMDRRQAMSRGEDLPERACGAALFADVTGFTSLAESLERDFGRRRGAEELSRRLNRAFGDLIDRIHAWRGSVVGFSGDAVTCWLDGDDGRRATACALDLQQVMEDLRESEAEAGSAAGLAIKVAVSQGPVRRLLVGDPRFRLVDVVAGATVDRMAAAEKKARQGEVVVGPRVLANLGDALRTSRRWRDGSGARFAAVRALAGAAPPAPWPALAPETLPEDRMRPFLHPRVYEWLRAGQGRFLAEVRTAVPLFLSFEGLDYDRDDAVADKLDRYVRGVQAVLDRFAGSMIDLTTGDKGSYLYAVFGSPISHEDDAARAVAAARELLTMSAETAFIRRTRIGVSQGRLRTGASGSPTRRTYTALGDETNLAARLMSRARHRQILVSRRIVRAARQRHRFRELGEVTVKGKRDPIPVHEVLDPGSEPEPGRQPRTRLIGRRAERQQLAGVLGSLVEDGEGAVVILEGEAGIGKSKLLEHLLEQAAEIQLPAWLGGADAVESGTSYHAWRPIWRGLLGLGNGGSESSRDAVLRQLRTLDDGQALELAPLLGPVLSLPLPDTELTAQMDVEARAEGTRELLVRLLRRCAGERPLLLVLEDAHWLDSASWSLAGDVARDLPPLVLVLATRPLRPPLPAAGRRLLESPAAHRLTLSALAPDEVLELVGQRLGVESLPEPVARLLHDKAEGNPFFSEELAYALRDARLIQVADGRCHLAPEAEDLGGLDFPETIEGVITSRIDRLGAAEQLTVKVASVIGRVFARRLLEQVHPAAPELPDLGPHLGRLEALDIVRSLSPEPGLSYIFKHVITQEVAYGLMLFAQRRQLHRAVARWYESRGAEDPSTLYPLLAHHWTQAIEGEDEPDPELLDKAIGYLEKAGDQARRTFANREVIRFVDQALAFDATLRRRHGERLAASSRRRSRWHSWLGRAYLELREMAPSRAHYHEALRLLGQPAPARQGRLRFAVLREVLRQIWHQLRPRRLPLPRPAAEEREDLLAAGRIYNYLAEVHLFGNDPLRLFFCALRFANLAARAGPSAELAESRGGMCLVTSVRPLRFLGGHYFRKVDEVDPDLVPPATRARVLLLIANGEFGKGWWRRMGRTCREGAALCERLGDLHHWGAFVGLEAQCALHQGDLGRCREAAEALVTAGRNRTRTTHLVWGLQLSATLALRQGRAAEAVAAAEEAIASIPPEDRLTGIACHGILALARSRLGEPAGAVEEAEETGRLIALGTVASPIALWGHAAAADALLEVWERGVSEKRAVSDLPIEAARRACRDLRNMGRLYSMSRPDAFRCAGTLARLAGRPRRARRAWRESLRAAERLAMPYEQALAHHELGRHLPAEDASRHAHLERASELFRQLGAPDLTLSRPQEPRR